MKFLGKWLYGILLAFDRLANVALFFGDPEETISGRCGKMGGKWGKRFRHWIDNLFWRGHCVDAIKESEGDDQLINDEENGLLLCCMAVFWLLLLVNWVFDLGVFKTLISLMNL